jgi:hypothetical protein
MGPVADGCPRVAASQSQYGNLRGWLHRKRRTCCVTVAQLPGASKGPINGRLAAHLHSKGPSCPDLWPFCIQGGPNRRPSDGHGYHGSWHVTRSSPQMYHTTASCSRRLRAALQGPPQHSPTTGRGPPGGACNGRAFLSWAACAQAAPKAGAVDGGVHNPPLGQVTMWNPP